MTQTMTQAQLVAEVTRLQAENARLQTVMAAKLSMKVTDKGGISVYGLGRWPVTLYAQQWRTLLGHGKSILAFVEHNQDKLAGFEAAWVERKAAGAATVDPTATEAARLAAAVDARLGA